MYYAQILSFEHVNNITILRYPTHFLVLTLGNAETVSYLRRISILTRAYTDRATAPWVSGHHIGQHSIR